MSERPDFDPEAVIAAVAPMLGLTIADAWRPGVAANLGITADHAALVVSFPLDDHEEPASVFTA